MRRIAGKVSVTAIVVVAFVIGLVVMMFSTGEGPMTAGAQFMDALARGDVDKLVSLSYADGVSDDELREQWDYTMNVAAPHYQFTYELTGESKPSDESAIVRMNFVKDAGTSGAYSDRFELPMLKTEDGWKVEVYSIDRKMFPGLPR